MVASGEGGGDPASLLVGIFYIYIYVYVSEGVGGDDYHI